MFLRRNQKTCRRLGLSSLDAPPTLHQDILAFALLQQQQHVHMRRECLGIDRAPDASSMCLGAVHLRSDPLRRNVNSRCKQAQRWRCGGTAPSISCQPRSAAAEKRRAPRSCALRQISGALKSEKAAAPVAKKVTVLFLFRCCISWSVSECIVLGRGGGILSVKKYTACQKKKNVNVSCGACRVSPPLLFGEESRGGPAACYRKLWPF